MSAYNREDGSRFGSNGAYDNYRSNSYRGSYYGSSAYDLSLFEPRPPRVRQSSDTKKPRTSQRTASQQRKSTSPARSSSAAKSYGAAPSRSRSGSTSGKSPAQSRKSAPTKGAPTKKAPAKNPQKRSMTKGASKSKQKLAPPIVKPYEKKAVIRWVALGALLSLAVMLLVVSNMENHELTAQIEIANAQLQLKQQDYEAMCVEFDTKMSDAAVEEYAETVLGMQKRENSQTEWISLGSGDVFETTQPAKDSLWVRSKFASLLSYND